MTDPLRWTDEGGDASEFERELLSEGQGMGLSVAQKQQAWAGILLNTAPGAAVAAGAGATPSVAPGATQAAGWGLGSKLVGIAALLGAVGGGTWIFLSNDPPRTNAPLQASNSSSVEAPVDVPVDGLVDGPSTPAVKPSQAQAEQVTLPIAQQQTAAETREPKEKAGAPPNEPASSEPKPLSEEQKRASRLREESLAVLEIRRTLRGGNPSRALSLLEQARQDFSAGVLGQEREALTIEALVGTGARTQAAMRAQAFLKNYPQSPFAADVTKFAAP